ncbi:GMC family oxidoreductase [Kocuria sp.]|uniref:GMC family oxidoreductase n=1 Tax=Kocuria sp. TaxID=1871328 RepID=UPI0026E0F3D0|nr:GMC family oxidoreductase [Kocuria sp.]MDO5368267.1 GMC family oxidoreductase [Kocuria sp.]
MAHTNSNTSDQHTVVIGAGTAGSIVAGRLAAAGHAVTLLEAGGQDTNPAIAELPRLGELWHSAEDWDYFTVAQEHASGRVIHWPRGRVLGGSHALNASIWVRGNPLDYDDWAAAGCDGWSWSDVGPVFEALENYDGAASPENRNPRGEDGPIPVVGDYERSPIFESIIAAAEAVGVEFNPDYNGDRQEGVSYEQLTIRHGKRCTTYTSYVKPLVGSGRITVRTGAIVEKLLIEDGAAVGVELHAGDNREVEGVESDDPAATANGSGEVIRADQVILCAGALDSPKILLRSGIGPAGHLRDVGIEPVVDLPGVGENLHDHLLLPVIAEATTRTIDHQVDEQSVSQTHLFWRSDSEQDRPDTQPIHFCVPMYDDDMTGPANAFTLHSGLVRPYSRGTIRLTGPSSTDPAEYDPQIFADPRDRESLRASFRQARDMVKAAPLAEGWGAREICPESDLATEDEENAYMDRAVTTYHHQVGTCKMGTDPMAVVDPATLKVYGVEGLRVVDASIMPAVTTGNTNAPSAMIGEKGARMLLGEE